jgi:hypothetical protein
MKSLIAGLILFLSFTCFGSALANGPEYYSSRNWILEKAHISDEKVPHEMLYLGVIKSQSGFVVLFRKDAKIQYLIAMTAYKQSAARVIVLRKPKPVGPVFNDVIKPGDKTNFTLRAGDVVWVVDPYAPQ